MVGMIPSRNQSQRAVSRGHRVLRCFDPGRDSEADVGRVDDLVVVDASDGVEAFVVRRDDVYLRGVEAFPFLPRTFSVARMRMTAGPMKGMKSSTPTGRPMGIADAI
jgi:hypothetical protein